MQIIGHIGVYRDERREYRFGDCPQNYGETYGKGTEIEMETGLRKKPGLGVKDYLTTPSILRQDSPLIRCI